MKTLLLSLITFVTFVPVAAFAQQNLVNLPIGETGDFNDYINAVYLMFISIAALIAVIKIIIAGVKYMFSDIVTQKSEAKRDIQGALLGLLVVLAAVVVLTIINPDLTTFDPDITAIIERPVIPNTGPENDVQTIQQFCTENEGQCTSQSCEYLATDYWATWVVNDPINRLACSTFCNGVVVGRDALNEGNCLFISGEIPVNLPELTGAIDLPCLDFNGTLNCDQAREVCRDGYDGVPTEASDSTSVSCSPIESSPSIVDLETDSGNTILNTYLANNSEYDSIVTVYAVNQRDQTTNQDLTPTELQAQVDVWADACEVDQNGNDTGNTYVEVQSATDGIIIRACLN